MKERVIFLVVSMLFISTFVSVSGITMNSKPVISPNSVDTLDWWPMFQHDPGLNGYASTKAPNTNTTLWINDTGGGITSSPAVGYGNVYIGSYDSNVYCFNAITGREIWRYTTGGYIMSSPAIYKGKVYIGSLDANLYCLDALDGSLIWKYQTPYSFTSGVGSSPVIYDKKVYVGAEDGKLYCFDADPFDDGIDEGMNDPPYAEYDLIWFHQTINSVESSPAIANGRLYVLSIGLFSGGLYCLNAYSGSLQWLYQWWTIQQPTISSDRAGREYRWAPTWSSPAVAHGNVYFIHDYGELFCLNAVSGEKKWSYTTDEDGGSSPAIAYGRVYVGTSYVEEAPPYNEGGKLYCLDARTGRYIWNFTLGHFIYSSPAIANGKVYFGSFDNNTYCLNARSGRLIWSYLTNGWIRSSPAIAEGRVYIASYHEIDHWINDGKVYAFEDSYDLYASHTSRRFIEPYLKLLHKVINII